MILGSNQPYFLPYIGYWQLINAVDVFELCDDFNYIKHGWINRNRILINGEANYYRMDLQNVSSNRKINEHLLLEYNIDKKLRPIQLAYSKAPYFENGYSLMKEILEFDDNHLADFLENSTRIICNYLDIKTKIIKSSGYDRNRELKKEYGIYDSCKILGADTYYNAIGGKELYSFEEFQKNNIKLGFIECQNIVYKQFDNSFIPNLSILDVIMFNSKEEIKRMLKMYTIVSK